MLDLLIKELKRFIIESDNKLDIEEELNNNIYKISIEKELKRKYKITDDFISKLEELSIEHIILLKLELLSNKHNIIIPMWFISKLDNIVKFILVKYALSKFNNISDILVYLKLNKEIDLIKIVNSLNFLPKMELESQE